MTISFTDEVKLVVSFVDEVLNICNIGKILESTDFEILDTLLTEHYFIAKYIGSDNSSNNIDLFFEIGGDSLIITIDRVNEALVWGKKEIIKSQDAIAFTIKQLLQSHIVVEYYGDHYTTIILFDSKGVCLGTNKHQEGIGFKKRRTQKLFFPISTQKEGGQIELPPIKRT